MKNRSLVLRPLALTALIAFVVASRFLPHMPNLSPLGAIALFGGAQFEKRWQAFLVPLLSVFVSDLVLNNLIYAHYYESFVLFYDGFYWQYATYALTVILGAVSLQKGGWLRILTASSGSAVLFFVISNFGVWAGGTIYTMDAAGLLSCYVAAIPFFKGTLIGNVGYSAVLFSAFALAERSLPGLRRGYQYAEV